MCQCGGGFLSLAGRLATPMDSVLDCQMDLCFVLLLARGLSNVASCNLEANPGGWVRLTTAFWPRDVETPDRSTRG
jgi:hypothetical protein